MKYSVGVRIGQYGVTPDRYMGVLWIFLEIIYLIIYFTMHRFVGRMLGVIVIAVIFALVLPGVNMFSVSISSQERILSQYKKEAELSEESKEKIYGAYEYLLYVPNSEKYIEEKYTKEEIEEIKGFYNEKNDRYYSSDIKIRTDSYINDIDIKDFSKMQILQYDMKNNKSEPDLKRLKLTKRGSEEVVITVNLEDIIESYVDYGLKYIEDGEYYVNIDSYYMEHYQINLDDNKVLIISNFEIEYDKETEKVEDLGLTVYMFQ